MSKKKIYLDSLSLFDGIPEAELQRELECMGTAVSAYPKNSCIIREGEQGDRFGAVVSGSVRLERTDEAGNRNLIAKVSAGQLFGISDVLSENELSQGVYAIEDCQVILLKRDIIYSPCGGSKYRHIFMLNLLRCMAQANRRLSEKIEILSKRTTEEKLMAYLSLEAKKQGKREFDISFDRQALADYLCVDRSALSAKLGKMRDEGLIDVERSHFKLL